MPTIPCHGCLDLGSKQTKTNRTHNQTNQQERRSTRRQPPTACMHELAHSTLARACGCVGCPAQARLQCIKCARRLRWRAIVFVTCGTSHVTRCTPHSARRTQRHIGKSGITCGLRLHLAGEQHADAAQRRRGWPFCRVQDGTPCVSCVPPAATQCTAWFCCNGARYVATAAFKMGASRGYYKGIQGVGMPAAARPASDGRVARLFAVACCALCAACAAGCMSLVVYRRLHVSG